LTPAHIDRLLADFRAWLSALAAPPPAPDIEPPAVDLAAVVAQFTALRHDVNLQTKAVRAATEQTAAVVAKLPAPSEKLPDVKPLLKSVIDIADALLTAYKQVAKAMDAVEPLANELDAPAVPPARPGFFARLFGAKPVAAPAPPVAAPATKLAPLLAGLSDGYAISLRRVEAVLSQYGLTPIECEGEPFDPETMEAIEQVASADHAPRTVVEEVRRGYHLNGTLHRFAQVKVAR